MTVLSHPARQPGADLVSTVSIENLSHWYGRGSTRRQVLQSVDLEIAAGEVVLLTGPSGCGKTTLLTLIGALRQVQQGDVRVFGQQLKGAGRGQRQQLRRRIGMIFQGHNLLRCLTAEQNVQMGADLLAGFSYRGRRDQAREWLRAVGLEDHLSKLPQDLSGGQKQRICIARALAANPDFIICDEVTSALDQIVQEGILKLLLRLQSELGLTYLFITHDISTVRAISDQVVVMNEGRVVEQGSKADVFAPPHPAYTELLLSSVPEMDPDWLTNLNAARRR